MPQANASLVNATITLWPTPTIGNFSVQRDPASGDLQLSGVYQGTHIDQTVSVTLPCLLFIDTANGNFFAINDVRQADPSWQFYGAVKQIA